MPKALLVWSNDWIYTSIPRTQVDALPDGRGRHRPYGEREVTILRTAPCTAVYFGGTEGEPQPGGGRLPVDQQAQARADAIVAAWNEWQAQITEARAAVSLPQMETAREEAREARNAVLLRLCETTASGLAGLAIKARIAANLLVETDPKASARSYDADDSDGLLLDLTGDILTLTGGLPAAHRLED